MFTDNLRNYSSL